jgi:hypothetical protein
MAGEQGYLYEQKCNKKLQKLGVLPGKITDYGGSDNTIPDGAFIYKNKEYKLEYKLDLKADLGQATLAYDMKNKKWYITGKKTPEGLEIQELLKAAGAETLINSKTGWKDLGPPEKILADQAGNRVTKAQATKDYAKFKDKFLAVPSSSTNNYYAAKGIYYIQIGGFGFYHMAKDPANIGAPQFLPNLRVRFRLKAGGSGLNSDTYYNYRFTVALQAQTRPSRSMFDIDRSADFLVPGKSKIKGK